MDTIPCSPCYVKPYVNVDEKDLAVDSLSCTLHRVNRAQNECDRSRETVCGRAIIQHPVQGAKHYLYLQQQEIESSSLGIKE